MYNVDNLFHNNLIINQMKINKLFTLLIIFTTVVLVVGIWGLTTFFTEKLVRLTIHAVIYDNQTPIEGVNLYIEDQAGNEVAHGTTNSKGDVRYKLKPGNYHIYANQGFTGGMGINLMQDQEITLRVSYAIQ